VSDTYDPYKPGPATTQSDFYSPSTQSAYDPYKPSVTSNPPTQHDAYNPGTNPQSIRLTTRISQLFRLAYPLRVDLHLHTVH
jgi:hypothetical protein